MANRSDTSAAVRATRRWAGRDWLLIGNVGLLGGLLLSGLLASGFIALMRAPMTPPTLLLLAASTMLFLLPSLLAAALTGRPGAALAAQAPVALVLVLLTPFDADALLACAFVGLVAEPSVAAFTRYRAFGWRPMALSGLPAGLLATLFTFLGHPMVPAVLPAVGLGAIGAALGYGAFAGWLAARLRTALA